MGDVAVAYLTDWEGWTPLLVAGITLAAAAYLLLAPRLREWLEDDYRIPRWFDLPALILWGLLWLAAALVLYSVPGAIMRRLPEHGLVWWVVLGGVVAAAAFFAWGLLADIVSPWFGIAPAIAILAGTIIGAGLDALNRAAASIPMSAGALFVLIVAGVIFVVARTNSTTR